MTPAHHFAGAKLAQESGRVCAVGSSIGFATIRSATDSWKTRSADFIVYRQAAEALEPFPHPELFLRGFVRWFGLPLARVDYTPGACQTGETKFTLTRMLDFAAIGIVAHSTPSRRVGKSPSERPSPSRERVCA